MDYVAIAARWTHIAAMSFLVGGALYARFVVAPAASNLSSNQLGLLSDRVAERLRLWLVADLALLVASGLYNLLRKAALPPGYHLWFGIKMLLALHVAAASLLSVRAGVAPAKRIRAAGGIAVSGLAILALSAYLRALASS